MRAHTHIIPAYKHTYSDAHTHISIYIRRFFRANNIHFDRFNTERHMRCEYNSKARHRRQRDDKNLHLDQDKWNDIGTWAWDASPRGLYPLPLTLLNRYVFIFTICRIAGVIKPRSAWTAASNLARARPSTVLILRTEYQWNRLWIT